MSGDPLLPALVASKKYRDVSPDVLTAAIIHARERAKGDDAVLKLAKRKLHQWFGAFVDAADRKAIVGHLRAAASAADDGAWRGHLAAARARHASTRERQGEERLFWDGVTEALGVPASVMDLGCGLGPLALPEGGLPSEVHYLGVDVDGALCEAVTAALVPRYPAFRCVASDVRTVALPKADLALLLKLVPTLEQVERGSAAALLARLDVGAVAVSFPRTTLSGRDVGMEARNDALATALFADAYTEVGRLHLAREAVFLARRRG